MITNVGELCWLDPHNQLAYAFLLYAPLVIIYILGIFFTAHAAFRLGRSSVLPRALSSFLHCIQAAEPLHLSFQPVLDLGWCSVFTGALG